MKQVAKMGELVSQALDETPGAQAELNRARADFLSGATPRRSSLQRLSIWGGALSLALGTLIVVLWMSPADNLGVTVDGEVRSAGASLESDREDGLPMIFSDGSSVVLRKGTGARLVALSERGALVNVVHGTAEVSVVHDDDTEFSFRAGPFVVLVTGTRFSLSWDPQAEVFSLNMHEGSVAIEGPGIAAQRLVVAGQELRLAGDGSAVTLNAAAEGNLSSHRSEPESLPLDEPSLAPAEPRPPSSEEPGAAQLKLKPQLTWVELARQGEYSLAVQEAEKTGIPAILATAPGAELLRLADSAFYSGRSALAQRTLTKIRARFPNTPVAARSAFALGRLHPGGEGIAWFETYLREQPSGPLAREALGRVLEARAASQDPQSGVRAAKQYLARFPGGPRAGLAVRILKSAE